MTCNEDCLNCIYPDCIKDDLPEEKEKRREYVKEWKRKNPERYEHQKSLMRAWSRKRYHELKAKGICVVCGKQKAVGGIKCPDCTAAYIEYARRYRRKKKAEEMKWIPCSERLPEKPYGCLVTVWDTNPITMDEFENILPYFVGWDGEQWNDGEGEQCPFEVIAWMPLPEPWKGETDESSNSQRDAKT